MKSLRVGKFIFGDCKKSTIWACNVTRQESEESRWISLPTDQILFVLPVSSALELRYDRTIQIIEPGTVAVVRATAKPIAIGCSTSLDALLIGIAPPLLASMLENFRPGLDAGIRQIVFSSGGISPRTILCHGRILNHIISAFREPPVSGPARSFWFEGQVKALLSLVCFLPSEGTGEFFCSKQKRLALSRIAKAKIFLESHLDETLDLQGLALAVGCSPFYLSRTFSATTGVTISQYVRKLRIEKAADLLVTGRYNVSEAAIEVGYQSLSHFSKAFQQVKGCLPSKYEAA